MSPEDLAAWDDYLERNRRAKREYRPEATRVTCQCGQQTQSSRGICLTCRTKDRA